MSAAELLRVTPPFLGRYSRALRIVERNALLYRRTWLLLVSGFFEPMFYLLSIGIGIGKLVGPVGVVAGHPVGYSRYVAPALLAASAMNGAVIDATFNVFYKLKISKYYEAVLATPVGIGDLALGEVGWSLLRGLLYATAFLVVMAALGLVGSFWALLDLPVALAIGFAFAAIGIAGTTFLRSWQDFEFLELTLLPMFLFSATFYPLSVYPAALQVLVRLTPLYQGVAALRQLTLGAPDLATLGHVAYLGVLGVAGLAYAKHRLTGLLRH